MLRGALTTVDELAVADDDLRALILRQLGDSLRRQGLYRDAHTLLRQALDSSHSRQARAAAFNALGVLAKETGRYADAHAFYAEAMQLVRPTEPAVPALLHNVAGLAHAQGRFDEAEQPARHALQLHEQMCGADSEEAAADASVLGAVLLGQERYAEAETLLNRAIATWSRRYGNNHYEVAVNLHNLAALYRARGEVQRASTAYAQALRIKKAILGEGHQEVLTLETSLSGLHRPRHE